MKKLGLFFGILWTAFSNISCEKDIIINTGNVEQKLVVEAWIVNGESPVVLLSKTYPSYGTINFIELLDSLYLEGAIVIVKDQFGNEIQLQELSPADLSYEQRVELGTMFKVSPEIIPFFPITLYSDTTGTIIGQELGTYDLSIDFNGEKLSATTTIPRSYTLDSLNYVARDENNDFFTVNIFLTLPDIPGNYIRYATKRNSEPFYYPERSGATWSDLIFAGAEDIKLPAERGYNDSVDVELEDFGLFEYGDTVSISWKNIDKKTYDFWYSIDNDGGDTPFSSPVKAASNINGGLGIWAGYYISYQTIIIE